MSCANIYDWILQSQEHKRHAMTNYPVSWDFVNKSRSYEDFITFVNDIRSGKAGAYTEEFNRWWKEFGETWDKLGCTPERVLGEHTKAFQFQANPTVHRGLRQVDFMPYIAEGPRMNVAGMFGNTSVAGLAGYAGTKLSCFSGRCNLGQTPWEEDFDPRDEYDSDISDWETGQSDEYDDDWWSDSDKYDTGTPSSMPDLKEGYYWCSKPPSEVKMVQSPKASDKAYGWTVAVYSGLDNQLYYRYDHANTNVRKWACPVSNKPSASQKADIKTIQKALVSAGYSVGTSGADGIFGPNTCKAAFDFKAERLNQYGAGMDATFFNALGLGGKDFEVKYGRLCDMYYKDVGRQAPVEPKEEPAKPKTEPAKPKTEPAKPKAPVVVPTVPTPEPAKAGFPLWLGIALGGGAVVTALVMAGKKKKGRK